MQAYFSFFIPYLISTYIGKQWRRTRYCPRLKVDIAYHPRRRHPRPTVVVAYYYIIVISRLILQSQFVCNYAYRCRQPDKGKKQCCQ